MKRQIAILLLSSYLISTTELYQLLKLPMLVEHFIEHKTQNTNLSLWQFLCLHYAHGDVKDADYEKDMKLPFKTHDNSTTTFVVHLPAPIFSITITPPFPEAIVFNGYNPNFSSSTHLAAIWQPPKFC